MVKSQAQANAKRRKFFRKLFNRQMRTLRRWRCPDNLINLFLINREDVIQKTLEWEIEKGERLVIPFFPVIPPAYWGGLYGLAQMARPRTFLREQGYGYDFLPEKVVKRVGVIERPHFIIDTEIVDIGFNGETGVATVEKDERLCHTFAEDAALLLHFNKEMKIVNPRMGLWCPETVLRYNKDNIRMVYFFAGNRGEPCLGETWLVNGRSGMNLRIASSGRRFY